MKPFTVLAVVFLTIAALISISTAIDESKIIRATLPGREKTGFIGTYSLSYGDRKIGSFHGIPYAKPPIGHRRFASPEPYEYHDYMVVTTGGKVCPRPATPSDWMVIDEDCLYLDVFQPMVRIVIKLTINYR